MHDWLPSGDLNRERESPAWAGISKGQEKGLPNRHEGSAKRPDKESVEGQVSTEVSCFKIKFLAFW